MSESSSTPDMQRDLRALRARLCDRDRDALEALRNPKVLRFVADVIELCNPQSVMVVTDDPADIDVVRRLALETGEERPLAIEGHTIHFDGYYDQARDKANTKYLLEPGFDLGERLLSVDRSQGLSEVRSYLDGAMTGKVMMVRFLCLGPVESVFSLPVIQITDSSYVAHSESLLYRTGYQEFKRLRGSPRFFRFLHSAGELENMVSKSVDKRRVYIDLEDEIVYSVNTQYAGNTIGLKKLAFRLAIRRAREEGWLAEHMFVMAAHGPRERKAYFTGAFPSACGKTSTSMIEGQTIIGDDLAYLRKRDGRLRAVNVESGIFGIIRDVNRQDDPVIWDVLTTPGEVIFTNILVTDQDVPYWLGDKRDIPDRGVNHSGRWVPGKIGPDGQEVPHASRNARYTVAMKDLSNRDPLADDPNGVVVSGIIFGGRDSDTCPPVQEAFDWTHGVVLGGGSLESETTAATLGQEGVRKFNLMSILDFLSIPIGDYIDYYLEFPRDLEHPPRIFTVNYFLKDEKGEYLNGMNDKNVWLAWMERRVHDEVRAIETPAGRIPWYDDLAILFQEVLGKEYTRDQYREQFRIRIDENLSKLDRIEAIYRAEQGVPARFFSLLDAQRQRFLVLKAEKGNYPSPDELT